MEDLIRHLTDPLGSDGGGHGLAYVVPIHLQEAHEEDHVEAQRTGFNLGHDHGVDE